jgi:hypothetical protein
MQVVAQGERVFQAVWRDGGPLDHLRLDPKLLVGASILHLCAGIAPGFAATGGAGNPAPREAGHQSKRPTGT